MMKEKNRFFDLMDRTVVSLIDSGLSDEEAFVFASQIGDFLSSQGRLPKMPDDSSKELEFKTWNDAVASFDFSRYVAQEYKAGGYGE